jgi:hypothetical protein
MPFEFEDFENSRKFLSLGHHQMLKRQICLRHSFGMD